MATLPPASAFDPARHMRIAEVKRGMKGYGLSVFRGTKIERFEVEVIDVLRNFCGERPNFGDAILIRSSGANLEHTGSIAGMSGSPIYLFDEAGNARMIGAFAYGWPLAKDPIAGVQPIEYMLDLPTQPAPTTAPAAQAHAGEVLRRPVWKLSDSVALPGMTTPPPSNYPLAGWGQLAPNPLLLGGLDANAVQLRPLATPLMTAGAPPELLRQFTPLLSAYGMIPLQAGGGGSSVAPMDDETAPTLEPGSAMVVPLLMGDVEFSAVGTCTEVIGDRVYGFGHGFNNEGDVELPVGTGRISTVVANLVSSFKMGELVETRGTLRSDQIVGMAGRIGEQPQSIPIELRVVYADGSFDRTYRFRSALHPQMTPILSGAAIAFASMGRHDLPQYHTLIYDFSIEFANGRTIQMSNEAVNAGAGTLFFEVATPMMAAADNPFERVYPKQITGTVRVESEAREGTILYVNVPRLKYRPGEMVRAYIAYRPFRAAEAIMPIEFEIPADLPEGQYQLSVSDWKQYLRDEQAAKPFRFAAEDIGGVFSVLEDVARVKHNAVYVRLLRQPDGIAIGRTAMPHLPSSRREVLMGAGRSNTTPFVSSTVKTIPTPLVMSGSAEFVLTIDKNAKVEVRGGAGAKPPANETARTAQSPSPGTPGEGRGEGSSDAENQSPDSTEPSP